MLLKLISPVHQEEYAVSWVEFDTTVGNFVIQPNHAPMIVQLAPESVTTCLLRNGKQKTFLVSGGFAHVTRTDVTILLHKK